MGTGSSADIVVSSSFDGLEKIRNWLKVVDGSSVVLEIAGVGMKVFVDLRCSGRGILPNIASFRKDFVITKLDRVVCDVSFNWRWNIHWWWW